MSEQSVLDEETWRQEAEALINDIKKHVKLACVSPDLPSDNRRIFINLTTLESEEYCVELSAAGFRIVSDRHDDRSRSPVETRVYETPYALLNHLSAGYRQSFGGELMSKLLDLAKQEAES